MSFLIRETLVYAVPLMIVALAGVFAERSGITVLRCYCDRALSAKTDNRPQFLEMIRDA